MSFSAVVVAAGSGERAGGGLAKVWRPLAGRPVARWAVEGLLAAQPAEVLVVVGPGQQDRAAEALAGLPRWRAVVGGATRALSVQAGLAQASADQVLIHDAARPFVTAAHVRPLLAALAEADGAVPALPVADTLKRQGQMGAETVDRQGLWRAQTPQAFGRQRLAAAYAAWIGPGEPTDDAAVVERAGGRVAMVAGDPMLMKLTYPEDFPIAERLAGAARITRIGQGLDAHRFGPGEAVWLCGVEIPHERALIGHSDADAGLHALTDALLGALGEGDIGEHFPPSDPQWRGAASEVFLTFAAERVTARGGRILNVDVTLVCEAPRIRPYRAAMRERLAALLGLPLDRVAVKATTTEGLGFTGRREGLVAQAVAAIETPA
jgi:2-C-methyl-D-erythritol 4-phosphate cytidylyltransferase / 2-C-methyl-D-erythritol 2,4-cyclodiphosphate synthase